MIKLISFFKGLPFINIILGVVGAVLSVFIANQTGKRTQKKETNLEVQVYEMSEYIDTVKIMEEIEEEIIEERNVEKNLNDSSKQSRIDRLRKTGIVRSK